MRSAVVVLLLLAGSAAFAQDGGATPAPQTFVDAGLGKLRRGDLDGAVAELRVAFAKKPTSAAIATDLGFALGKQDNLREAEVYLRRAMDLDPRRFYAYVNLADLLAQSPDRFQRGNEIVARLKRGLGELKGNERGQTAVTMALANFERSLGRLGAARARLHPLLAETGPQPARLREIADAIAADEAALALEDWPEPLLSDGERQSLARAQLALRDGDLRLVLERTAALLAVKPGCAQARFLRARALARDSRFDEAEAELSLLCSFVRRTPRPGAFSAPSWPNTAVPLKPRAPTLLCAEPWRSSPRGTSCASYAANSPCAAERYRASSRSVVARADE